jgi:hypothetical protein
MYCCKCGAQNDDNAIFCSECGLRFRPDNYDAVPVQPVQPGQPIQPSPAVVPILPTHSTKNNVMCLVGFYGALSSIVMMGSTSPVFFIISLIGLIKCNKTKEPGRGYAIAGIIITSVMMGTFIVGVIAGLIQRDY